MANYITFRDVSKYLDTFPQLKKPAHIGHYSMDENGEYKNDDSEKKYLKIDHLQLDKELENPLNIHYDEEKFVEFRRVEYYAFPILHWIRDHKKEIWLKDEQRLNVDFITLRGTYKKIFYAPYSNQEQNFIIYKLNETFYIAFNRTDYFDSNSCDAFATGTDKTVVGFLDEKDTVTHLKILETRNLAEMAMQDIPHYRQEVDDYTKKGIKYSSAHSKSTAILSVYNARKLYRVTYTMDGDLKIKVAEENERPLLPDWYCKEFGNINGKLYRVTYTMDGDLKIKVAEEIERPILPDWYSEERVCGSGICLEESKCVFKGAVKGPSCGDTAVWCSCGNGTSQATTATPATPATTCTGLIAGLYGICASSCSESTQVIDSSDCQTGNECCQPSGLNAPCSDLKSVTHPSLESFYGSCETHSTCGTDYGLPNVRDPVRGSCGKGFICSDEEVRGSGTCLEESKCVFEGAVKGPSCGDKAVWCSCGTTEIILLEKTLATTCTGLKAGLYGICAGGCASTTQVIDSSDCEIGYVCCQPIGLNAPCSDLKSLTHPGLESFYGTCETHSTCGTDYGLPNVRDPVIGSCGKGFICCIAYRS
ncbi:hypothetical protein GQR58_025498 [Nymphon striatum]|nr:hypothetical protein GQR58_025498 [Nymphon striatum]